MVFKPAHVVSFVFVATKVFSSSATSTGLFLGTREQHFSGAIENETNLLLDLENILGHEHRIVTEDRVARMVGAMHPIFTALQKDASGSLDASAVRYMLHRVFVERHGWFVKGLETSGKAWSDTSPISILDGHSSAQDIFENKFKSGGFDLHHSAVLAATFETIVHGENIKRLKAAYRVLHFSPDDEGLTEVQVAKAMEYYMAMYIDGRVKDLAAVTPEQVQSIVKWIPLRTPSWNDALVFVTAIRKAVVETDEEAAVSPNSWNTTLKALEKVGERYGHWQDRECRRMKSALVGISNPRTGRVQLDEFYRVGLNGSQWLFMESIDYLRELGALDEADPLNLAVIVPNYVNGHSNCLASSKYYEVCCIDECNALWHHLETHIASSTAKPAVIAQLVANLRSDTVTAPRILSETLLLRLAEIAAQHGGAVRLHSRLFAQWMHHAYPNECAYPHLSGSVAPLVLNGFASHKQAIATKADMAAIILNATERKQATRSEGGDPTKGTHESTVELIPWSGTEEFFVYQHEPDAAGGGSHSWKQVVLMTAVVSALFMHLRSNRKAVLHMWKAAFEESSDKLFV